MKAFNLISMALAGALISVLGFAALGEQILGHDTAQFVVMPLALLIGMNARRIAEKLLGYTLLEAMQEGSDNDAGN